MTIALVCCRCSSLFLFRCKRCFVLHVFYQNHDTFQNYGPSRGLQPIYWSIKISLTLNQALTNRLNLRLYLVDNNKHYLGCSCRCFSPLIKGCTSPHCSIIPTLGAGTTCPSKSNGAVVIYVFSKGSVQINFGVFGHIRKDFFWPSVKVPSAWTVCIFENCFIRIILWNNIIEFNKKYWMFLHKTYDLNLIKCNKFYYLTLNSILAGRLEWR